MPLVECLRIQYTQCSAEIFGKSCQATTVSSHGLWKAFPRLQHVSISHDNSLRRRQCPLGSVFELPASVERLHLTVHGLLWGIAFHHPGHTSLNNHLSAKIFATNLRVLDFRHHWSGPWNQHGGIHAATRDNGYTFNIASIFPNLQILRIRGGYFNVVDTKLAAIDTAQRIVGPKLQQLVWDLGTRDGIHPWPWEHMDWLVSFAQQARKQDGLLSRMKLIYGNDPGPDEHIRQIKEIGHSIFFGPYAFTKHHEWAVTVNYPWEHFDRAKIECGRVGIYLSLGACWKKRFLEEGEQIGNIPYDVWKSLRNNHDTIVLPVRNRGLDVNETACRWYLEKLHQFRLDANEQ
ncbi:hypothetical protein BT63DRAFT_421518 [Microthyrium microscopicum]|uniref:Uncharacterized protein n=1 Tax=Microthyrium microscopicum TaxID=703497 RepID=A0A6A6UPG5_9PEZI|nr:hypothetical protein BT63DRAFT_421518 [Microthyrium microscopicum]